MIPLPPKARMEVYFDATFLGRGFHCSTWHYNARVGRASKRHATSDRISVTVFMRRLGMTRDFHPPSHRPSSICRAARVHLPVREPGDGDVWQPKPPRQESGLLPLTSRLSLFVNYPVTEPCCGSALELCRF